MGCTSPMLIAVEQDEQLDRIQISTEGAPTVAMDAHEVFGRLEEGRLRHG